MHAGLRLTCGCPCVCVCVSAVIFKRVLGSIAHIIKLFYMNRLGNSIIHCTHICILSKREFFLCLKKLVPSQAFWHVLPPGRHCLVYQSTYQDSLSAAPPFRQANSRAQLRSSIITSRLQCAQTRLKDHLSAEKHHDTRLHPSRPQRSNNLNSDTSPNIK